MQNNIVIERSTRLPTSKQKVEIVERKGLGHPDTICDSVMNQISVALCKEYIKNFGTIMHHNIDKSLLAAGEVKSVFGGGAVKRPMLLVFGDRATFEVGNVDIPVEEIVLETAHKWFKKNLRFVDPDRHIKYQVELKRGSAALTDIFKSQNRVLGANDTSAAVGYAPMTETEKIVLETEKFLNSNKFKKQFPESGEDVKVMGLRTGRDLELTIAMAFVDRFIDSEITYFRRKDEILQALEQFVNSNYNFKNVNLHLNALDRRGRGISGVYMTVLGTSADGADCGQVGRGNGVNGLIPLNRPAGAEAAAGKNPTSHVGKIYSVLSFQLAEHIYKKVPSIDEATVWLLSRIGEPVNRPVVINIQLIVKDGVTDSISRQVSEVVNSKLDRIDRLCRDLATGKIKVC